MIRPVTVATFLMACGSGLYLYQSKHDVQVLDRTIERSVRETNALREQSRLLATEWTMLNDPERLRQFSDTYLRLKTITPSQFSSLADLDNRLPAPLAEAPATGPDEDLIPVTVDNGSQATASPNSLAAVQDVLPVPPVPVPVPVPHPAAVATAVRPIETRAAVRTVVPEVPARPAVVVDARPAEPRPAEQRPAQRPLEPRAVEPRVVEARPLETRALVREAAAPPRPVAVVVPRPVPLNVPVFTAPPASASASASAPASPAGGTGGSLLGMARGVMPPAPRPTPTNAIYSTN